MGLNKSDPVLTVVGVILIIAVIAWIGASVAFPADPIPGTKYTSSGNAFGESKCCKGIAPLPAGCVEAKTGGCAEAKNGECQKRCVEGQNACPKSGSPSCRNA